MNAPGASMKNEVRAAVQYDNTFMVIRPRAVCLSVLMTRLADLWLFACAYGGCISTESLPGFRYRFICLPAVCPYDEVSRSVRIIAKPFFFGLRV